MQRLPGQQVRWSLLCASVLGLLTTTGRTQESPVDATQPAKVATPAETKPALPAETKPESPAAEPPAPNKERLIYFPFRQLQMVFDKENAGVFVPWKDYQQLWQKAWGVMTRPVDQPPVAGVITSADYVAKIEQDVAQVTATLTVQVLQAGWAEIPLKFGDAAIAGITGNPGPVLLRSTGGGNYSLLLSKPGEHTIELKLTAKVSSSPDGRQLEMQIPAVGITQFELTVPEADQSIQVQPKLLQLPSEAPEKSTRVKAQIGAADKITARWHPRVGTKPDMELLASVTNATLVQVENGLIHTDAWLTFEVLRGQIERVRFAVPLGHRVLDVASEARVKEWKVTAEEGRQVVTVDLLSRMSGQVTIELHTERPLPEEPFDVAGLDGETAYGIHALDVIRENGQVALRGTADLVLNATTQTGLQRIDESEADPKLKRPGASWYKFYSPKGRLTVAAKPVEPRLLMTQGAELIFTEDQLQLTSVFNITVERAGIFELKFKLPPEITVESVTCNSFKQFDVSADGQTLTVLFNERQMGAIAVTIKATRAFDARAEANELTVPLLEPIGAEVETGTLKVYASESLEVITDSEKIVGFQPDASAAEPDVSGRRLVSAWTYARRPVTLPARTVVKPTRLTAQIASTLDVKQGQLQVLSQVNYLVEFAGLDTFRIAVPEAVADRAQIQLVEASNTAVKQRLKAPQAVEGFVTWTVVLQREVLGAVKLSVSYDIPLPPLEDGKSLTTAVPLPRVLDPFEAAENDPKRRSITLTEIVGEATVKKDRALSVAATASGGDVETVDVRELEQLGEEGFVGFRYYRQPVELALNSAKYEVQSVVETVVSRALVEAVLDRSGTATFRARMMLKSSERQRLSVELPSGAQPLGVLLDRKPVSLEKNPDASAEKGFESYFVNVARTKAADQPFSLAILYRMNYSDAPFQTRGGKLELRLPTVGGEKSVAVQQLRVGIWIPDDYALVGKPENFVQESRTTLNRLLFAPKAGPEAIPDQSSWIGEDTGGVFDFPVEGHSYLYSNLGGQNRITVMWWHMPFYTWMISIPLVVIAFVLRKTRWENKLTVLILAAFAAATYALWDADLITHGLAVASYGLLAGAAIWIIHGLLQRPARRGGTATPPGPPPAAVIPPPGVFDAPQPGLQS